jgi:hypothetical protein
MKKTHRKLKDEYGHHRKHGINSGAGKVGHTGASQVLFEIIFVSYLFLDIQSITKLTKTKPLEYCMFEGFIKKKGQLRYK